MVKNNKATYYYFALIFVISAYLISGSGNQVSGESVNVADINHKDEIKQYKNRSQKVIDFPDIGDAEQWQNYMIPSGLDGKWTNVHSIRDAVRPASVSAPEYTTPLTDDRQSMPIPGSKGYQTIDRPGLVKVNNLNMYRVDINLVNHSNTPLFMDRVHPPAKRSGVHLSELDSEQAMLLNNDTALVGISNEKIYRVRKNNLAVEWSQPARNRTLQSARLINDKLFAVYTSTVKNNQCPDGVLGTAGQSNCDDVFHFNKSVHKANTYYHFVKLNAKTGNILGTKSFLGSPKGVTVYFSPDNLYIAQTVTKRSDLVYRRFINKHVMDKLPDKLKERLRGLSSADNTAYLDYHDKISKSLENKYNLDDIKNKYDAFIRKKADQLVQTTILRMGLNNFAIEAKGNFKGHLVNNFALDEHKQTLRVGTTVENSSEASTTRIYTADMKLNKQDTITNPGNNDQRIRMVRFFGKTGYALGKQEGNKDEKMTALDLAQPSSIQTGKTKSVADVIRFTHPLEDGKVFMMTHNGDRSRVLQPLRMDLQLFDLSSPTNPEQLDRYKGLYETDSNVRTDDVAYGLTHDSFNHFPGQDLIFTTLGPQSFVISYKDNQLTKKVKATNIPTYQRSFLIDDTFYITGKGTEDINMYNLKNWNKITTWGKRKY